MKKSFMCLCAIGLLATLVGCSQQAGKKPQVTHQQEQGQTRTSQNGPDSTASPSTTDDQAVVDEEPTVSSVREADAKSVPFNTATLVHDALIRYDKEPRIQSPMMSTMTPGQQDFTIFFREPIDQESVEQRLVASVQHILDERRKNYGAKVSAFDVKLHFRWASTQQLHLQVDVPDAAEGWWLGLNLVGTRTLGGAVLQDLPELAFVINREPKLFRVSTQDGTLTRLPDFDGYYSFEQLPGDSRYLLAEKYLEYCGGCDVHLLRGYSILDLKTEQLTEYPVSLMIKDYQGAGDFVADTRGFFYEQPTAGVVVPNASTAVPVQVAGHVYGASFSRDYRHVLIASGAPEQEHDFDLVIVDLQTGQQKRLQGVMKGWVAHNQATDGLLPIRIVDDGEQVTFTMTDQTQFKILSFTYAWATDTVTPTTTHPRTDWEGDASDDGTYLLRPQGGIYRGKRLITDEVKYGQWITGTHKLFWIDQGEREKEYDMPPTIIHLYDADRNQVQDVASFARDVQVIGTSEDGRSLYISAVPKK
ncbi:MAG TPA: hypothetical protein VFV52_09445 [Bacilli bacterium]|nr:hypothetical protein [Bacilli bacterium]